MVPVEGTVRFVEGTVPQGEVATIYDKSEFVLEKP